MTAHGFLDIPGILNFTKTEYIVADMKAARRGPNRFTLRRRSAGPGLWIRLIDPDDVTV